MICVRITMRLLWYCWLSLQWRSAGALCSCYASISTSLPLRLCIWHLPKAARICEIFGGSAISTFLPLIARSGTNASTSNFSSEVLVMNEGAIEGLCRHQMD